MHTLAGTALHCTALHCTALHCHIMACNHHADQKLPCFMHLPRPCCSQQAGCADTTAGQRHASCTPSRDTCHSPPWRSSSHICKGVLGEEGIAVIAGSSLAVWLGMRLADAGNVLGDRHCQLLGQVCEETFLVILTSASFLQHTQACIKACMPSTTAVRHAGGATG